MNRRFALLVAGLMGLVATFVVGTGAAYGDGQGGGLEEACSHEVPQEQNPNCNPDKHEDRQGGTNQPVNEPGPGVDQQLQTCVEAGIAAGSPEGCTNDADEDGTAEPFDNCPGKANEDQADFDGDGNGDACDPYKYDADHDGEVDDTDQDGIRDPKDNCVDDANHNQADQDDDGLGDVCDDDDNDNGVPDDLDPVIDAANTTIDAFQAQIP